MSGPACPTHTATDNIPSGVGSTAALARRALGDQHEPGEVGAGGRRHRHILRAGEPAHLGQRPGDELGELGGRIG